MSFKRKLAKRIVSIYYDQIAADNAEEYFNQIVVGKGIPDDIEPYIIKNEDLNVNIIFESGLLKSKGQARRMIKQSAVKIDGETITDIQEADVHLELSPHWQQISNRIDLRRPKVENAPVSYISPLVWQED